MRSLFFFFIPLYLFSQTGSEMPIRILQDKRIAASEELRRSLRSDNARERELALLAAANIQDTASFDDIAPLLNDNAAPVRSMAAFAVGMLGKPRTAGILFKRLSVERDEKCIAQLFNAIGMVGTSDDLRKMINQAEHYPDEWLPYIGQSIYRFANRKIKDAPATKFAAALLDEPAAVINACYALMRIGDTTLLRNNSGRIRRLMNNSSPLIRMWGSTMLGVMDDKLSIQRLISAAKKDKDWRVRVNSVRSLKNERTAQNDLLALFADANEHVALAAVASYETLTAEDAVFRDSVKVTAQLRSDAVLPAVKDEVRKLIARRLGERAIAMIGDWKSGNPTVSAQRIRAYGETRSEKAIPVIKEAIKQSVSSLVVIAGLEAFQAVAQRSSVEVKKDFLKTAATLFAKNDAGVSYSAAIAFQDTSISISVRSIFRSALISSYIGMRPPADLEPMVELLNVFAEIGDSTALPAVQRGMSERDNVIRRAAEKAFTAITGEDAPERTEPEAAAYSPFYQMKDLIMLDRYSGAEVTTSKGKIRIVFEKEAAPFTVLNFILLAQKRFYDGLSFHRVVSNFVIQGGDPLGNGSGGPDHSIRTEVHPNALYRTGAVGMASAGKDTEGSQWFITHCPTPHLDFRYSIFGYTRDNTVVDKIMIGDRIDRIVLF